ncbi:hypothetical protein [Alterisphingorhabdus coralli]|uniref:DUF4345 domain-containing protein n=1 Tax=Alterisphingorhabdus coralli TaxID=3071408 RepID=A0AA97F821_9SPHN|nr:hypothetical protein [Parasphingorhabdus sp. SCSIO 66989]WOE75007.1 hypothetical protein RB602_14400 [Parasphingorhabdus sp. SCSIO 66989]
MAIAVRSLIALLSLLYFYVAATFLFTPLVGAENFALEPVGIQGMATLRADFGAYFLVTGGAMLWGTAANRPMLYWVAIAILGITFVVRCFSLMVDGVGADPFAPMAVEAVTIVLLLTGMKVHKPP